MKEVVKLLCENPMQYFATVGTDGKAKCRPFMFCFEKENKLWFGTNNKKEVYAEMQQNPYVEVCISSPEFKWLRLSGKAIFENNLSVKELMMKNPIIKGQYHTADNPLLEAFYLEDAHAVITDMSGNPPKEINL